ncbi:hypothetical protein [Bacillus mycoides]|uniref:hypothetical protein n=1 Tax=Bacillus mycoides TaxID=1405 RepID=UPI003D1EAD5D
MTIEHDEDVLQIANFNVEPTPLKDQEPPLNYATVRHLYERARHTKRRDHAVLYVIARVNYIYQNDKRK